jgi:hypothetical protein
MKMYHELYNEDLYSRYADRPDPDKLSIHEIHEYAQSAIASNNIDQPRLCKYQFPDNKQHMQTPLALVVRRFVNPDLYSTTNDSIDLEKLAFTLIDRGANIFHEYSIGNRDSSIDGNILIPPDSLFYSIAFGGWYDSSSNKSERSILRNILFTYILKHPDLLQQQANATISAITRALSQNTTVYCHLDPSLAIFSTIQCFNNFNMIDAEHLIKFISMYLLYLCVRPQRYLTDAILKSLPDSPIKRRFMAALREQDLLPWMKKYAHVFLNEHTNPMAVNIVTNLLSKSEYNTPYLNDIKRAHLCNFLLHNGLGKLFRLEYFDVSGHETNSTWRGVVERSICSGKPLNIQPDFSWVNQIEANNTPVEIDDALIWDRNLGRTVILREPNTHKLIAWKLQKSGESLETLSQEFKTAQYLQTLKLNSFIPKPIFSGVLSQKQKEFINNIIVQHSPLSVLIADEETLGAYIYEVPDENYFTYLHDQNLSDIEFNQAMNKSICDLALLLNRGMVFYQLADMFHNREQVKQRTDQGRYIVLSSLILGSFDAKESGRLDRWILSIAYPNLRASGLADFGDYLQFKDYVQLDIFQEITKKFNMRRASIFLDECPWAHDRIYANILAEYLLVLFLIAGYRGRQLNSAGTWVSLAAVFLECSVDFMHILTGIQRHVLQKTLHNTVNVDTLAKQMSFWMGVDNSDPSYKSFKSLRELLESLYPDTPIKRANKAVYNIQTSHDGINPDLGAFNCHNPMKEDNKLYYLVANQVIYYKKLAHEYRNAYYSFEEAMQDKQWDKAHQNLKMMHESRYYHSIWQKKHVARCLIKYRTNMALDNRVQTDSESVLTSTLSRVYSSFSAFFFARSSLNSSVNKENENKSQSASIW